MAPDFLLYGSTGFVGDAIARLAVKNGLRPILAGRNAEKVGTLASELGLEHRVFNLENKKAIDSALKDTAAVLHCAGPYIHTFKPMLDGCLRTGKHYLDITGEIPVLETIVAHGPEAKAQGVMLMPGVGFDVVATDCLAAHLKQRLPSATQLTLAFHSQGPAGLPPGTLKTSVEMIPYGTKSRRKNGRLESVPGRRKTRMIDFGQGPVEANMLSWGDVITAFYSTGIPNIEVYAAFPKEMVRQMMIVDYLHPLFRLSAVRSFAKRGMKGGSTAEERARTRVSVWGEVQDDQERKAVSRLHGPEAGVVWTVNAALAVVQKVLANDVKHGFQTPSLVYGPDFVLEGEGVTREDLP
jgi:short subunit dehydrogenase-like uncharacterized protein